MSGTDNIQDSAIASQEGAADAELASFHRSLGLRYRRNSIILGVIGLFVAGIPFAVGTFIAARKAEAQGVKATAGKVLAVLDLISGIIGIVILTSVMKQQ